MPKEFKPTGKQLLRQHLKVQKAQSALVVQKSLLSTLAKKAQGLEEIVEHDGRVYKIIVSFGHFPVVDVEHLGTLAEFNRVLGVKS
jgi:histidine ammonia-lyase